MCGEISLLPRNSEVKRHEAGRRWVICGAGNGQWTEGGGCEVERTGRWLGRGQWATRRWLLM